MPFGVPPRGYATSRVPYKPRRLTPRRPSTRGVVLGSRGSDAARRLREGPGPPLPTSFAPRGFPSRRAHTTGLDDITSHRGRTAQPQPPPHVELDTVGSRTCPVPPGSARRVYEEPGHTLSASPPPQTPRHDVVGAPAHSTPPRPRHDGATSHLRRRPPGLDAARGRRGDARSPASPRSQ
ncbi:hypothetical protein DXG01_004118 [Tephrocybe rancida]|nr:hypothetical protein DXG01_004118 [Tephrocybe rancida]